MSPDPQRPEQPWCKQVLSPLAIMLMVLRISWSRWLEQRLCFCWTVLHVYMAWNWFKCSGNRASTITTCHNIIIECMMNYMWHNRYSALVVVSVCYIFGILNWSSMADCIAIGLYQSGRKSRFSGQVRSPTSSMRHLPGVLRRPNLSSC